MTQLRLDRVITVILVEEEKSMNLVMQCPALRDVTNTMSVSIKAIDDRYGKTFLELCPMSSIICVKGDRLKALEPFPRLTIID